MNETTGRGWGRCCGSWMDGDVVWFLDGGRCGMCVCSWMGVYGECVFMDGGIWGMGVFVDGGIWGMDDRRGGRIDNGGKLKLKHI